MKKNDEGFTLIELLIVIVILGILATVVVFAVGGITDQGEKSSCKADYKTMEVALEAYNAKTGGYPPAPAAGDNDDSELTTSPNQFMRNESKAYNYNGTGGIVAEAPARNTNGCQSPPLD